VVQALPDGRELAGSRPVPAAIYTTEGQVDTSGQVLELNRSEGMYTDPDGGSESGTGDGSEVERWEDQSGNGNDFVAKSYTYAPILRADGVDFDGGDDFMVEKSKALDLTGGFTVGTKLGPEDETSVKPVVGQWNETAGEVSFIVAFNGSDLDVRLSADGSTESASILASGVISKDVFDSVVVVYDAAGGTLRGYVNDMATPVASSTAAPPSLYSSPEGVEIGRCDFGGTEYFNGDWRMIQCYANAFTDEAQRDQLKVELDNA
jgi:hypothetical protein